MATPDVTTLRKGETQMPGGNRTGPTGMGPMTGRGAGYCGGRGAAGFATSGPGLGFGRGRGGGGGGGRGWRNMFHATGLTGWQRAAMGLLAFGGSCFRGQAAPTMTKDQELDMLRQQAELLDGQIGTIKQRIDELSAQGTAKE